VITPLWTDRSGSLKRVRSPTASGARAVPATAGLLVESLRRRPFIELSGVRVSGGGGIVSDIVEELAVKERWPVPYDTPGSARCAQKNKCVRAGVLEASARVGK